MKNLIVDFAYWAGWNLISVLPEKVSRRIFDFFAWLTWARRTNGVKQLELNLSRVLELDPSDSKIRQISRANLRNYMRYYCEIFLLPKWTSSEIESMVEVRNDQPVREKLMQGGVILALPHTGNWDFAGAWAANSFGSLCTVAERLRPEGVFQKFLKMRQEKGLTVIALVGQGSPYEFLKENLLRGMPAALLGDRDVAGSGMSNTFFGHPAKLPIGPAMLALDTGLPLFTCATWFSGDKLVIEFDQELEFEQAPTSGRDLIISAQKLTGKLLERFEYHIRNHPEAWHQMQPIWPDLKVVTK